MKGNIKKLAIGIGSIILIYLTIFGIYHETGMCRGVGMTHDSSKPYIGEMFKDTMTHRQDQKFLCAPQKLFMTQGYCVGIFSLVCEKYPLL